MNLKLLFNKISLADLAILQGAGIAFIIKITGAGVSFGLQVLLARVMSLEDYGSYIYIMAWISMMSGFSTLGFSTSLIRFIPEYLKKRLHAKLKGVIIASIITTFFCSMMFATLGLVIIYISHYLGYIVSEYSISFYLYGVGILFGLAFISLFGSLEKGKKMMFMAHAPSQLFKHLLIASGIYIVWNSYSGINVEHALLITFASVILIVLWHIFTIKRGISKEVFEINAKYNINEWIRVSFPLLLISGFLIVLNQTDVIMLGILSTKSQVGIYNVAYKVATLTSFVLLAVNAIAAPTISELYHQEKINELQNFARKIAHLIFWPTLVISIGLIGFAGFVLGLFGDDFIDGENLLIILLIGQLVNACVGSVGYYLNMTGHERDSARVFGVAALTNVIFNPIGIYLYGAIGAAVVTTLTTSMWNIWLYFLVKKRVGIKSAII